MTRHPTRLALALLLAGFSVLAASVASAANFGLRLSPTPAATNQAAITLSVNGTGSSQNGNMPVLGTSTLDVLYDSTSSVIAIPQAKLAGEAIQFNFGQFLHPCVTIASITLDEEHETFPPRGAVDGNGEFDLVAAVNFAGELGNNCNGDEIPYHQQLLVSLHGTLAHDINTGLVELTNLATTAPFDLLTFTFPVWTFQVTGTVTLNFEGTVQSIFTGDFETGNTTDWSSQIP